MLILERKSMLSREVTNEVCDEHTECEADGSQLTARQTKVQQSSHFLETRIVSDFLTSDQNEVSRFSG